MSDRKAIFASVKSATVALAIMTQNKDGSCPYQIVGSGFCVDPIGVVVTCKHVLSAFMTKPIDEQFASFQEVNSQKRAKEGLVSHTARPHVLFFDPQPERLFVFPCPVSFCMATMDFDLAGIRVPPHARYSQGFPFLEIEPYQNINEGDQIATCGFPLGNYLHQQLGTITSSFTEGIVGSIIPAPNVEEKHLKGFQLGLSVAPGNSGGPVFSLTSGKVFGVLQSGLVANNMPLPGLTKAEPVYPVFYHDFLNKVKKMAIPKTLAESKSELHKLLENE